MHLRVLKKTKGLMLQLQIHRGGIMKSTFESLQERVYNAILDHGGELTPKVKELVSNFTDDLINADDNLAEIVEK